MRIPYLVLLTAPVSLSAAHAQVHSVADIRGESCAIELSSGVRLEACVERIEGDTVLLELSSGRQLRLPGHHITHGILDVPSQGTWRPRFDQRRSWSIRVLLDLNVARAEYGPGELRGGSQVKLAVSKRLSERVLLGPMAGISAMRANYHEVVAPMGVSAAWEFTPRLGASMDVGYGLGLATSQNILDVEGGLHLHPRLGVKLSHPYNEFNIELGIGYLYQRMKFTRFEEARFIAETVIRPGIPGEFEYLIHYNRISFGITCTFW